MNRFASVRITRRRYGGTRNEDKERKYSFEDNPDHFKATREHSRRGPIPIDSNYSARLRSDIEPEFVRSYRDEKEPKLRSQGRGRTRSFNQGPLEAEDVHEELFRKLNISGQAGRESTSRSSAYPARRRSYSESEDESRYGRRDLRQESTRDGYRSKTYSPAPEENYYKDSYESKAYSPAHEDSYYKGSHSGAEDFPTTSDFGSYDKSPKSPIEIRPTRSRYAERSTREAKPANDSYDSDELSDLDIRSQGYGYGTSEYEPKRSTKTSASRDEYFGKSSRERKGANRTSTKHRSTRQSARRYSTESEDDGYDGKSYPVPKDSFEDLRGKASKKAPSNAGSDTSSTASGPLSGVGMKIVAIIFIGISATFSHVDKSRVYRLLERFLKEYHREASRKMGRDRIKQIYKYMQKTKSAHGYTDMRQDKLKEFEEETFLAEFKSRVRAE